MSTFEENAKVWKKPPLPKPSAHINPTQKFIFVNNRPRAYLMIYGSAYGSGTVVITVVLFSLGAAVRKMKMENHHQHLVKTAYHFSGAYILCTKVWKRSP